VYGVALSELHCIIAPLAPGDLQASSYSSRIGLVSISDADAPYYRSKLIAAPVYFCQPYHSWEKGGVENANKLIRRYIPKGCDISAYSKEDIWDIQHKINSKPRKILGYRTTTEVFLEKQKEVRNA
jgi:hypothetical protein